MSKHYKVEPPPIVRQIFDAGCRISAKDADGDVRFYEASDLKSDAPKRFFPPSWIKELEPEQIPASRIKVDAPVEVSNGGDCWSKRHFASAVDNKIQCWLDGLTSFSENVTRPWIDWRIPATMDPEAWKREWLIPEEVCQECAGNGQIGSVTGGFDACQECNGTGEVGHD